jgi:HK97 family phage major capsid protein
MRMGARMLSGLVGSVAIPKHLTSGSVGWIGEVGTATASELTVGQVTLSPKHLSGYQEISRQLLLQSTPDAENLVNADLAAAMALGLDSAVLAGTSTNSTQPIGIRFTSGLGTANPTSGTAVNYADMIRHQSTVAASNAMFGNFGYVARPEVAAILMGKPRFTNSDTQIWEGGILDGRVVGMPAMSSLQLGTGTVLSGDFSQVIVGEWGTLEIEVNPYANFQAGIIGVRAMVSVDVGLRYAAAFSYTTSIT